MDVEQACMCYFGRPSTVARLGGTLAVKKIEIHNFLRMEERGGGDVHHPVVAFAQPFGDAYWYACSSHSTTRCPLVPPFAFSKGADTLCLTLL